MRSACCAPWPRRVSGPTWWSAPPIGALNGVLVAADPAGGSRPARAHVAGRRAAAWRSARSCSAGRHGWCARGRTCTRWSRCARMLAVRAARGFVFRSRAAVPVRGGQYRGGHRALVLVRAGGPGGDGVVRRARAAAAGGDRREHYFDGGLVDSIPVGRAVALGASVVYVLQVGRIESPLAVPRRPWRWAWSRSRSRGGTGSTRRCRRCRTTSGCTCCRPAGTSSRPAGRSSATGTGPRSGSASSAPTPRRRATSPRWRRWPRLHVGIFCPFLSAYRIAPLR